MAEENSNALIERFSLVNAPQLDEEDDYPDPESDPTKPKKGQQYSKKHKKITTNPRKTLLPPKFQEFVEVFEKKTSVDFLVAHFGQ